MENDEPVIVETPNDTGIEVPVETFEETPPDEVTETPEVDVDQLQATNKKLYERAKKAEADLKALRGDKPVPVKTFSQLSVEETVLSANGMSDELLSELKVIAVLRKTSLIKAQSDPIFVAVKEQFEKEKKQKDASLPASRGSGGIKVQKNFTTPGLTREEHQKMVQSL